MPLREKSYCVLCGQVPFQVHKAMHLDSSRVWMFLKPMLFCYLLCCVRNVYGKKYTRTEASPAAQRGSGRGTNVNGILKTRDSPHLVQISIGMAGTTLPSHKEVCKLCIMHIYLSVFLNVIGKSHLFKIMGAN